MAETPEEKAARESAEKAAAAKAAADQAATRTAETAAEVPYKSVQDPKTGAWTRSL